ncbi:MAG TPA: hypothetical protein VHP60_06165, partial [Thermoanaerobaculia bacterium]|nr:hypothetical protein [Thermoanaerobaculia bacterium]
VALLPRVPPDRPFRVVPTVEEARVCLDWSAPVAMLDGARPVKVAGYAVYRGTPGTRSTRTARWASRSA